MKAGVTNRCLRKGEEFAAQFYILIHIILFTLGVSFRSLEIFLGFFILFFSLHWGGGPGGGGGKKGDGCEGKGVG